MGSGGSTGGGDINGGNGGGEGSSGGDDAGDDGSTGGGNTNCVSSCTGHADGNFASCAGCEVYVTCHAGTMYDNRPCGNGLIWNDGAKACDWPANVPNC